MDEGLATCLASDCVALLVYRRLAYIRPGGCCWLSKRMTLAISELSLFVWCGLANDDDDDCKLAKGTHPVRLSVADGLVLLPVALWPPFWALIQTSTRSLSSCLSLINAGGCVLEPAIKGNRRKREGSSLTVNWPKSISTLAVVRLESKRDKPSEKEARA